MNRNQGTTMRIAAGIFFIMASMVHGCVGCVSMAGGGFVGAIGAGMDVASQSDNLEIEVDGEKKNFDAEGMEEGSTSAKKAGAVLLLVGVFILILAGLQMAGAILLFQSKGATFVYVVAGLTVLAAVLSQTVGDDGGVALPIFALVTAGLGVVAAKSYA